MITNYGLLVMRKNVVVGLFVGYLLHYYYSILNYYYHHLNYFNFHHLLLLNVRILSFLEVILSGFFRTGNLRIFAGFCLFG